MVKKRYVKIKLVGHEAFFADENEKKSDHRHPDFLGDGVAVWLNESDAD